MPLARGTYWAFDPSRPERGFFATRFDVQCSGVRIECRVDNPALPEGFRLPHKRDDAMNCHLAAYHRAIENHRQAITEEGRKLARVEASAAWSTYVESQPKRTAPVVSTSYLDDRSGFGPTVIGLDAVGFPDFMQDGNVMSGPVANPWNGAGQCRSSATLPAPRPFREPKPHYAVPAGSFADVQVDDIVEVKQAGQWVEYASVKAHEVTDAVRLAKTGVYRIIRVVRGTRLVVNLVQ
jgi:hypothetical protein